MIFFAISEFEMILAAALAIAVLMGIFWMVVGWRTMRAHERLADSHETFSRMANVIALRQAEDIEATVVPARAQKSAIPPNQEQY